MDPIQQMYEKRDEQGRERARNYRKPPLRFRASEVADCSRKIWYRLSGYAPAPRYGRDDDFGIDGDAHHDIVRQLMRAYDIRLEGLTFNDDGTVSEDQMKTKTFMVDGLKVPVVGRCDGFIFLPDRDELALLEVKSKGFWVFKYIQEAFEANGIRGVLDRIIDKHPDIYAQSNITALIHDMEYVYVLIKNRDMCQTGVYNDDTSARHGGTEFSRDDEQNEKTLKKLANIKRKVMDGVPPPPAGPPGSKECGYCKFKYLCHDADKRAKRKLTPTVVYPDPAIVIDQLEQDDADSR